MAISSALRVGVQIAILPIIGRVLGPHAYGQIALVSPFIFFSMLLAESGLGACIVRAEKVTPELEGTVFCFSAGLGLFFIALFAAMAYPLGHILHEPEFPALLIGMSSILLLASLNIVPGSLLLRDKKYNWIALSDIASSLGSLAGVTLGIALGWGAWSLVAQQVALWVCKITVFTIGSRTRPHLIFRWSIIRENMHFGSNLTGSSILTFIARNIDNILIGRFMGAEVLGFYALAFQIVGIPQMVVAGSVYFTIFSSTAEAKRSGASSAGHFLIVLRGVTLVCAPAIVGLAATAQLAVAFVLGDKWTPTAQLIGLLAPFGLAQTYQLAMSGVLNGLGRSDLMLRINIVAAGVTIVAIMLGVAISSPAVAIGVSLASFIFPLLALRVIHKECGVAYKQVCHAVWGPLTAAVLMGIGVKFVEHFLPPDLPPVLGLMICIAAGIVFYTTILLGLFRDRLTQDFAQMKVAMRGRNTQEIGDK